ncbi:hypothetical protein P4O66_008463 [Electrophorus voltai]|uniref:Uncharacterized protein n=1 Tax=Electrophorus voltai TaxID=2609070 RepID=A0AAD8ZDI8_9TELE|nr:hypothetical protein P4O66_008463 [Electrophorus voltai]
MRKATRPSFQGQFEVMEVEGLLEPTSNAHPLGYRSPWRASPRIRPPWLARCSSRSRRLGQTPGSVFSISLRSSSQVLQVSALPGGKMTLGFLEVGRDPSVQSSHPGALGAPRGVNSGTMSTGCQHPWRLAAVVQKVCGRAAGKQEDKESRYLSWGRLCLFRDTAHPVAFRGKRKQPAPKEWHHGTWVKRDEEEEEGEMRGVPSERGEIGGLRPRNLLCSQAPRIGSRKKPLRPESIKSAFEQIKDSKRSRERGGMEDNEYVCSGSTVSHEIDPSGNASKGPLGDRVQGLRGIGHGDTVDLMGMTGPSACLFSTSTLGSSTEKLIREQPRRGGAGQSLRVQLGSGKLRFDASLAAHVPATEGSAALLSPNASSSPLSQQKRTTPILIQRGDEPGVAVVNENATVTHRRGSEINEL